jgi:hypothetical protein
MLDEYGLNLGVLPGLDQRGSSPSRSLGTTGLSPEGAGLETSVDGSLVTCLTTGSPKKAIHSAGLELGSPVGGGQGGTLVATEMEVDLQAEASASAHQAKGLRSKVVYARTPRPGSSSARKSKRLKGSTVESVLEKAKHIMAEKNLDTGTSPRLTLSSRTDSCLSKVLADSCIIFNLARGSPGEILDMIRAKELAQANLAAAAEHLARVATEKAAREAAEVAESAAREVATASEPAAEGGSEVPVAKADALVDQAQGVGSQGEAREAEPVPMLDQAAISLRDGGAGWVRGLDVVCHQGKAAGSVMGIGSGSVASHTRSKSRNFLVVVLCCRSIRGGQSVCLRPDESIDI